jgi:carboxyl-terminal processing protease
MPKNNPLLERVEATRPNADPAGASDSLNHSPDGSSRRRTGVLLAIGIALSTLCVLILCAIAVSTGGLAIVYLQRAGSTPAQQSTTLASVATAAPITPIATATGTPLPTTAATATPLPTAATVSATAAAPVTATVQAGAAPTASVALSVTQRQLRIFDDLWDIVNQKYVYPDFNGFDWPAARKTSEARIRAGMTNEQFYDMLRDLIVNLNDDHSSFLSPEEAREEDAEYEGTAEYVGIGVISDVNIEKRYAFVLQVIPGSPAASAGILPHDHILAIDGQSAVDEVGNVNTPLMRGPAGTPVTVTVRTPGDSPRDLTIKRASLSTSMPVESRILPGTGKRRIGYLYIPTFYEQNVGAQIRAALRGLVKGGRLDGLIVDIRTNAGGSYPVLMTSLGFFTRGNVGTLADRKGVKAPLTVKSERVGTSQTVPTVVLIGPSTQSFAEVFAGSLQAKGRVKLIGQRSGGNIETLHAHRFEDGSVAWIAEETFRLPDGSSWEGEGLQPDVLVDKNWDEYSVDDDPVIAAAVAQMVSTKIQP